MKVSTYAKETNGMVTDNNVIYGQVVHYAKVIMTMWQMAKCRRMPKKQLAKRQMTM